jgi:hypothetical protein
MEKLASGLVELGWVLQGDVGKRQHFSLGQ